MTDSLTPPPAGRLDIAVILRRIEYGTSEEDRAALLAAMNQKIEATRAWGIDLAQDAAEESRRVAEAAAERRAAEAEESRTTYANQVAIATEAREREHREMYERQAKAVRIHTDRAEAAARENERLRREIDRLRDALGWDADDPEDNYDLVSGDAALAAEPREESR